MKETTCLNVSQMEYLHKLGVDIQSASMQWVCAGGDLDRDYYVLQERDTDKEYKVKVVPAFTLGDLLHELGNIQIQSISTGYKVMVKPAVWDHALPYPGQCDESLIGATYKLLCYLKRKGL